jgi:hypothetical protein
MSFAILTQTMTANQELEFDFASYCAGDETIQQIVYGITQFTLQEYSDYFSNYSAGSSLQDVVISLAKTSGGVGSTSITLQANFTLSPGTPSNCSASVTALAYIGNTSSVILRNQPGITGISDTVIDGLTGVPNVCAGVLSGFSFTSSDSSEPLGFGAFAGAALAPGNPPTKPTVLPMGSGVCQVTNNKPMTTTVDVGTIIFTADQPDIVSGTIVDCLSFTSNGSTTGKTLTIPTSAPVSSVAVFLQSFALQFRISASVRPTPPFNSAIMGASAITPTSTGFTFTSSQNMFSCIVTEYVNGEPWSYGYYYAESYTATYFYIGLLATS